MGHSKGGFLIEDNGENEEETRRRQIEKERQRERREHNIGEDLPVHVDGPRCEECDAVDIDAVFLKVFRVNVCKKCQNEKPEKYSLLTKTECKEDYLLTDRTPWRLFVIPGADNMLAELRDADLMPHLLKANPHKSTYANMMLYLRCQVEAFAWTKWGSPEALDAEYARRQAEKDKKKSKKFEESLKELRKRTKENLWEKRQAGLHRHVFGPVRDGEQKCDCGLVIEVDEF